MYEELIQRLRNDAKNQEQMLHICDSTKNALEAASALEDLDAQLDVLVKADVMAQRVRIQKSCSNCRYSSGLPLGMRPVYGAGGMMLVCWNTGRRAMKVAPEYKCESWTSEEETP